MLISFIIPAYNEELLLADTLAALRTAADGTGEAHEIILRCMTHFCLPVSMSNAMSFGALLSSY